MTDALAPNTAIEQWCPTFGPLPDGWVITRIDIEVDYYRPPSATVEFAHGPGRRSHLLRLSLNQATPDVREWLYPLMTQIARLPHEAAVDLDARVPMYGRR